jgi:3D (Asp-Asp-Asp) domain-containing protein
MALAMGVCQGFKSLRYQSVKNKAVTAIRYTPECRFCKDILVSSASGVHEETGRPAMSRDQVLGAVILVASIIVVVVYGWLLYAVPMITLQVTAFIAVGAVLVIAAWIGWVMATTPPPAPLEPEPALMSSGETETKRQGG